MIKENFENSLEIGRKKEKEILNIFRNEGWLGDLLDTGAYGDLWVMKNKIPYIIQVKNEDKYSDSLNICIEIYQGEPKRPSGISICEGQICIHTFGNNIVIYRTQYMRLFISANQDQYRVIDYFKSDNNNKGILLPRKDLINFWWFDICPIKKIPESKIFLKE